MIEGLDKMTSALKTIVSKNKRRYQENGYNLDLTYINKRLIAMGFPSENVEALFRNSLETVKQFLDEMHKDHYRIYNLCSERDYDAKKFHGRVVNFPFDDHNPPNFNSIIRFCEDAEKWLNKHKDNVCVVHCKAGKGRTGVMICCFLLHSNRKWTAEEALSHYGRARTIDSKGVTIPSQKRYISYYSHYLREKVDYLPRTLFLESLSISSYFPSLATQSSTVYVEVHQMNHKKTEPSTQKIFESKGISIKQSRCLDIPINVYIAGDVKIELHSKGGIQPKKELFHCWFNTAFLEVDNELSHFLNISNRKKTNTTSNGSGGPLALGSLLKDASISEDTLHSSSDSSSSSSSSTMAMTNPLSESLSNSSFRDKRVRHSSVPQTGVTRNNYSSSSNHHPGGAAVGGGKHIEVSLSKSQLDKFLKDKLSRRTENNISNNEHNESDPSFPVVIRLIQPQNQSSWTPPPSLHPPPSNGSGNNTYSSPESSSTEEDEQQQQQHLSSSLVFQQQQQPRDDAHNNNTSSSSSSEVGGCPPPHPPPRQTWI